MIESTTPTTNQATARPTTARAVTVCAASILLAFTAPRAATGNSGSPNDTATAVAPSPCTAATTFHSGPAPTYGGDPAVGEAEDSYWARTGDHLPECSGASLIDGVWCLATSATGAEPVVGETDDSYFARTGHHLP